MSVNEEQITAYILIPSLLASKYLEVTREEFRSVFCMRTNQYNSLHLHKIYNLQLLDTKHAAVNFIVGLTQGLSLGFTKVIEVGGERLNSANR